jgi:hypothetical protein
MFQKMKLNLWKVVQKIINGNFDISDNRIRDLEGSPKYVHGKYDLSDNAVNFSEIDVTYYTKVGYNSISRFG